MLKKAKIIKVKKNNSFINKLKKKQKQKQYNKLLNQEKLLKLFNKLIKKKQSLTNFKIQKKILYFLNDEHFNKNLGTFLISNFLSLDLKKSIIDKRRLFLLKLKLKLKSKNLPKKVKKKKLKKKKLNRYFKFLLLNRYSLLNRIKMKLKKKNLNFSFKNKKNVKYLLLINIRSNNIFINFSCFKNKKLELIKFWSCGIFKLHCTKRKLKFIVYTMLKEVKKKIKFRSFFIIKVSCAHFLHKFLYRNFKKLFLRATFIIFNSFKIFNGCRSKKKRRKKHLKFRILK